MRCRVREGNSGASEDCHQYEDDPNERSHTQIVPLERHVRCGSGEIARYYPPLPLPRDPLQVARGDLDRSPHSQPPEWSPGAGVGREITQPWDVNAVACSESSHRACFGWAQGPRQSLDRP